MIFEQRARCRRIDVGWVFASIALALGCSTGGGPNADASSATQAERPQEVGRAADPEATTEVADPEAQARIDLLMGDAADSFVRAADFLAAQERFSVVADVTFDAIQEDGRSIEFGARREVTIRRPDRLRMVQVRRDGESRTLTFDGSAISIDLPDHAAYVQMQHPGSLYAALDYLVDEAGAPVALARLFSEDFRATLESEIRSGYYVETVELDGRTCEHLSFRLPDVDVQLWIEEGDRPLIARIVITYKHARGRPQFRANLRDWDLSPEAPDAFFRFEPPEGSERLAVESLIEAAADPTGGNE